MTGQANERSLLIMIKHDLLHGLKQKINSVNYVNVLLSSKYFIFIMCSTSTDQEQDSIICPPLRRPKDIKCSSNEVIKVHDVVFLGLSNISDPCSKSNVTSDTENASLSCKFYVNKFQNRFKGNPFSNFRQPELFQQVFSGQ